MKKVLLATLLIGSVGLLSAKSINLKDLESSCQNGTPDAQKCFELGNLYNIGYKVGKDEGKAFELYTKACDLDNAGACYSLGLMFQNGVFEKDDIQAKILFEKSCKLGNNLGCSKVAPQKTTGGKK